MTTLGITPLIQNQLQFGLDQPPTLENCVTQRRRPAAIVVEKLGLPATYPKPRDSLNPMRFSTISEDDMHVAMRLAKRDLKKKRMEVEMEQYMNKMAERAEPKLDKKDLDRRKARERLGIGSQTPKSGKKDSGRGKVMKSRNSRAQDARRPHSPPTRDTDSYPKLTADERTALEIRRLRKDLRAYTEKFNSLDVVSLRPQPAKLSDDITDEEYYNKQKARVLGRATRSSRMVYDLKQQVRAIYDEIRHMNPEAEPRRRSDVIKKLAAAHRATVRALQDLIHQLPEAGHDDVSKLSRDLGGLIQQLTDCCHEMEIADPQSLEKKDPRVEKLVSGNPVAASVWKEVAMGPIEFSKEICRPYQPKLPKEEIQQPKSSQEDGYETDERAKILKTGIESLIRARSPEKAQKPAVTVTFESEPRVEKQRESRAPANWSVLINRQKKKSKKNLARSQKPAIATAKPHYTEETVAHKTKIRERVQRQPARSRSRSPRDPNPRIVSVDGIEKLNLGIPNEWVEQAETAIRQRLQPMLQKATKLRAAQSPNSMRQLLSVKALDRIECNAGLLVDLILEDLLKDTATELVNLETEEKIENDANLLIHGSEIHTMLDRIELMEREQMEIRDRWNSVKYNDTVDVPSIPLSDRPRTPEPTLLKAESVVPKLEIAGHPPRPKLEKSPIVFTNERSSARLRSEKLDMLRHQAVKDEVGLVEIPHKPATLSEDEVEQIHHYRKLKMISHQRNEKTLKFADKMTDEILDLLLTSAAEEMMKSSSEMDNQVCMQELALGQNVLFSTDTEMPGDENATQDERFPANFEEDSVMDLHDMIHDDLAADRSHLTERSLHSNRDDTEVERIVADAQQRSFHDYGEDRKTPEPYHESYHSNDENSDHEVQQMSYHDDRRQAEADKLRSELDDLDQFEVGNLVRRSFDQDDESVVEESDSDDVTNEERRAALLGNDVMALEPIHDSQETEGVDVDYSSEFVTTTADDSTGN